jgi:Family of unknown function (DUF6459)
MPASAIRAVTVPDAAPPYDDAAPGRQRTRMTGPSGTGTPTGAARVVAGRAGAAQAAPATPTAAWPSQFAQVLAETLAGSRPPDQISTWTTEQARRRIRQLAPVLAAASRPRIRRVIVTSPVGGVLEMAVVVGLGGRVRALAIRLELARPTSGGDGHWLCTAVEAA